MGEWLVHRPRRGRSGFKPAGDGVRIIEFLQKNPKNCKKKKTFTIIFFSSFGISQPVLLRLHLSLPGMSFARVHRPSFVPLRSLSVAIRLSLVSPQIFFHPDHCRLPADLSLVSRPARPLSVASRHFLAFAPFLVPSWHCRLPADFLWLRPRYCAYPAHSQVASRLC